MAGEIATVYDGPLSEDLLLGTADIRLRFEHKRAISRAVFAFVESTTREI